MRFRFLSGIRGRLGLVVVLSFLPAAALLVFNYFAWESDERKKMAVEAYGTTRLLANSYESLIEGTRLVLEAYRHVDQLNSSDREIARSVMRDLLSHNPQFSDMGLILPDGRLFSSVVPLQAHLNLSSQPFYQRVKATGEFAVGDFQRVHETHRRGIQCGVPIREPLSRSRILYASIDPAWVAMLIQEYPLPRGAHLSLVDRKGIVVASNSNRVRPGTPIPKPAELPADFFKVNSEVVPTWVGDRLIAATGVKNQVDTGLRVVYEKSLTEAWRYQEVRAFKRFAWLLLFCLAVAAFAWATGHLFITKQFERLLVATEGLGKGDLTARTGISNEWGELGQLAKAIDRMADRIQQRGGELQMAKKGLEQAVEERTRELEETNRHLEAFNYSISHDLRAPLRAIDGFSQILLNEYAQSLLPEGRRILNVVVKNTKHMAQLIDDLLAFSRLGRQEVTAVDINMSEMARDVLDELSIPGSPRTVESRIAPLPPARGDSAMVRQVWTNLIANALKFTGRTAQAIVEIGVEEGSHEHTYFVKDNGVGFEPKAANKLFQVFQRLHRSSEFEGTGVGLAIVARIVQKHGGRVWAESRLHEGATFYFTLPATATGKHL